jgi:hypothetical protein
LVSQVLTLFTTPVIYIYLDRIRHRGRARTHGPDGGDKRAVPTGAAAASPRAAAQPHP